MSKYRVHLRNVVSFTATVEADSEEAAIEAAYEQAPAEIHGLTHEQTMGLDLAEWAPADEEFTVRSTTAVEEAQS